jgi:1,4-alpha-glucan branching enzyme
MRKSELPKEALVVICNFTPEVRDHYRIGVPHRGTWKEVFNSDDLKYGGGGCLNQGLLHTSPVKYHNRDYSVSLRMPPLAVSVIKLNEELAEFEIE